MASIEAIMVTLMPTLNVLLSVAITLEAATQNNLSHLGDFQGKYLWWSSIIVKSFTYDFETYDIVKLYLLVLLYSQFKLYIILINFVNVNHLSVF